MQPLSFCVYVLRSEQDGLFYIGFTTNLKRRLEEHAEGKSRATACRRPFKLVYCEYHLDKADALRREHYFKSTIGKRSLRLMIRKALAKDIAMG